MKVKLLRKLREIGRNQITIYSVTMESNRVTGMEYGCSDPVYMNLFCIGDTEEIVHNKAARIFLENNIERFRKEYRKYSRRNRL